MVGVGLKMLGSFGRCSNRLFLSGYIVDSKFVDLSIYFLVFWGCSQNAIHYQQGSLRFAPIEAHTG